MILIGCIGDSRLSILSLCYHIGTSLCSFLRIHPESVAKWIEHWIITIGVRGDTLFAHRLFLLFFYLILKKID
jgi:hypothetical protein